MGALDNCTTPAGKRLLSQWLCRPLLHISDITARQDAVQDLISPECADAVGVARKAFSGQWLEQLWNHNQYVVGSTPTPICNLFIICVIH